MSLVIGLQLHLLSMCLGLLQIYGKFEFQRLLFSILGVSPPRVKPQAWHVSADGFLPLALPRND